MSVEQIIEVPQGGKITIELPSSLKATKRVKLTINEFDDSLEAKIALLKQAATDKDFLADMHQVNQDFEFAESNIN